jgi:hypothetical protein
MVEGEELSERRNGAFAPHLWERVGLYVASQDVYNLLI